MNQSHRNLMQEIRLDQAGCQHTLPELNSAISASTQQNPALTRDDASRLSRNFSEEFPLIQPRPSLLPHRITAFPQSRMSRTPCYCKPIEIRSASGHVPKVPQRSLFTVTTAMASANATIKLTTDHASISTGCVWNTSKLSYLDMVSDHPTQRVVTSCICCCSRIFVALRHCTHLSRPS